MRSDSGKKGVDFEKYEGDHVDFYWCLSECADKDYCRGFEYRYDNEEGIGKFEIWLRYYGNVEEYLGTLDRTTTIVIGKRNQMVEVVEVEIYHGRNVATPPAASVVMV